MLKELLDRVTSWKSTITGLLIAVVIYEMSVGNKIPENKQEWAGFVLGVLAIALGVGQKDASKVEPQPQRRSSEAP